MTPDEAVLYEAMEIVDLWRTGQATSAGTRLRLERILRDEAPPTYRTPIETRVDL